MRYVVGSLKSVIFQKSNTTVPQSVSFLVEGEDLVALLSMALPGSGCAQNASAV